MSEPHAIVDAFIATARAQDLDACAALCTPDGWTTARRLARGLGRGADGLELIGALQDGDRAAVQVHWKGHFTVLLQGDRIAGVTKSADHAGGFVDGRLPASLSWADLPADPLHVVWAEELLAQLRLDADPVLAATPIRSGFRAIAALAGRLQDGWDAALGAAHAVAGRGIVEVRLTQADRAESWWLVLQDRAGTVDCRGGGTYASFELLLEDL